MATLAAIQPSFAAGELSPFLYGRVDLAKYHTGARTLLNFLVHPHGGASNRPGTRFVGGVGDHAVRHRLIPFRFRASPAGQNYALVFGHLTMQVVMNGGFVESSPGNIYTLSTPYAAADLPLLKHVQSADTMTLTHPGYAPRQLTRTGHAAWTLEEITFAPSVAAPENLAAGDSGTSVYVAVTAIAESGEESLPSAEAGSSGSSDTWTWNAVDGAAYYNIYKQKGSIFGFVAQVATNTWTDDDIGPNIANTPPGERNPFDGAGEWPACSTYYQQRQVFGGSENKPQNLWFSATGAFNNMNVSSPTRDDDAITRALVSREVNEVRHLVPGMSTSLLAMTAGAEWRVWPGPSANALTPGSCVTLPQSSYGCSHVPPILAGGSVLFVQERGSRVRAMEFELLQDRFQAKDMTVLSQHLLYDTTAQHTIEEWAFAEEPFRIVWAVRSDGALLGFTFMPEHEVYAWHRHATDGVVESVCSIPEAEGPALLDAAYLIVRRTIGGETRRYVERMAPRTFATIADAWFLDCGLKYEGAPVSSVSGLDHLEGKTVAILGDGSVVPGQVVTGGAVQLDGEYAKVIVGLPYTADLETLNLELPAGGTSQGRMKKIAQVTIRVKESRGAKVGLNQAVLQEVKQRQSEPLGSPMQPFSGDWRITIPSEWNTEGRLFVRQSYPLPVTILDLIPEVALGK